MPCPLPSLEPIDIEARGVNADPPVLVTTTVGYIVEPPLTIGIILDTLHDALAGNGAAPWGTLVLLLPDVLFVAVEPVAGFGVTALGEQ